MRLMTLPIALSLFIVTLTVHPVSAAGDAVEVSVYVTAGNIASLTEEDGAEVLEILRRHDASRVVLEVYRSGRVVPVETLTEVRDFLRSHGYEAVGGIATVPGGDFGVHQEGQLGWFNYQAQKTRDDLAAVMADVAPVFDFFVVDDFLCTADVSEMSREAKGDRSWSAYRRDLMVSVARDTLIAPARAANPDITLCVKFPQWYDLFHTFGYDVVRKTELFDVVWVGTETRGRKTQRFGFIQPYLGFVNYRWMLDIAGDKLTVAWFDHGDCDATDFVDQAYQSVLAGAPELLLFNYANLRAPHEGSEALPGERNRLESLSRAVDRDMDAGVLAYKPPHSDAGGDMYLLDFLGMLGIPLVPVAHYPDDARVLILPTQAAADPDIAEKLVQTLPRLEALVVTAGFLEVADDPALHALAGVAPGFGRVPVYAETLVVDGEERPFEPGLEMAAPIRPDEATVLLEAVHDGARIPYLTRHPAHDTPVFTLNAHTYTDADFKAVNEVLLAPRWLRLLDVPEAWANTLRRAFAHDALPGMRAPASVTLQPVRKDQWFVQNYRDEPATVVLRTAWPLADGFGREDFGMPAHIDGQAHIFEMPARSRLWVRRD